MVCVVFGLLGFVFMCWGGLRYVGLLGLLNVVCIGLIGGFFVPLFLNLQYRLFARLIFTCWIWVLVFGLWVVVGLIC